MSHTLYTTKGFVLDSKNSGEANKLLYILTRDLGLVMGTAQGARHLKSKLRYHMQQFTFGEYSLVRGKEIWRITGAKEAENTFSDLKKRKEYFLLYARVLHLLKRLLTGEEKHAELFDELHEGFNYLQAAPLEEDETIAFENILVLRILYHLGYVRGNNNLGQFVEGKEWNSELLKAAVTHKSELVREINASLKASQL
jgi:DNA repair protein RecO (recombination protein O)